MSGRVVSDLQITGLRVVFVSSDAAAHVVSITLKLPFWNTYNMLLRGPFDANNYAKIKKNGG